MKKHVFRTTVLTLALVLLLTAALSGCGRKQSAPVSTPAPAATPAPVPTPAPAATPAPVATAPGRQDGERFESVIILEGMEEPVRYEHVRNDTVGIEMDYDYEKFVRQSEPERECFVSVWDDPQRPENYLEVTYNAQDAETVAAAVSAALSQEYELLESSRQLERAGSCIRIEASVIKGTNSMADQLQAVFIIPAADGCRVATAHYAVEAAEGFGRRFSYMLNTLTLIDRGGGRRLTDEQALAAVRSYCCAVNPDLAALVEAGEYPAYWELSSSGESEIVVVFRSYTGAINRYYIDPVSGETSVTEFVPGIMDAEQPTGERFNAWDYASGQASSPAASQPIPGTWQTGSIVFQADGTMAPEYYVQFTDTDILYGHMTDGAFVCDHADQIFSLEESAGGYLVRAEASNGVRYSYRTCESDDTVLEYFETWNEDAFPEMYRGGASLSRSF